MLMVVTYVEKVNPEPRGRIMKKTTITTAAFLAGVTTLAITLPVMESWHQAERSNGVAIRSSAAGTDGLKVDETRQSTEKLRG